MNLNKQTIMQPSSESKTFQPGITTLTTEINQYANLTIRVKKCQRLHWLIEAKKQGTSLTSAITEALNERFGKSE